MADHPAEVTKLDAALAAIQRSAVEERLPSDLKPLAQEIARLAEDVRELPLNSLPTWLVPTMAQRAQEVVSTLQEAMKPDPARAGPMPNTSRLLMQSIELYRDIMPAFAYLGYKASEFAGLKDNATRTVETFQASHKFWDNKLRQEEGRYQGLSIEAESLIRSLRTAAGESGIARFAGSFNVVAKANRQSARSWFGLAIAGLVLTVGFVFLFAYLPVAAHDAGGVPTVPTFADPNVVFRIAARLVVLGLFVFLTGWAVRMYRARVHLEEVNRAKAAALNTFRLFARSAASQDERDAILRAASEAIFAPGATGMVDAKEEFAAAEVFSVLQKLSPLHGSD